MSGRHSLFTNFGAFAALTLAVILPLPAVEHNRFIARWVAWRHLSQAHSIGHHLSAALGCDRRLFMFPPSEKTTLIFAAIMGPIWLRLIPRASGLVAELFGTRTMATMLGLSFVHQAGSVLGAWGGGVLFTHFGSYDLAWRFGAFVGVILTMFGEDDTWRATWPGHRYLNIDTPGRFHARTHYSQDCRAHRPSAELLDPIASIDFVSAYYA